MVKLDSRFTFHRGRLYHGSQSNNKPSWVHQHWPLYLNPRLSDYKFVALPTELKAGAIIRKEHTHKTDF